MLWPEALLMIEFVWATSTMMKTVLPYWGPRDLPNVGSGSMIVDPNVTGYDALMNICRMDNFVTCDHIEGNLGTT